MSLQELSLRDGLVVCPQCLTSYQAVEAGSLTPPGDNRPSAKDTRVMHYCPHCGESIGDGINYCPYCGGNLHVSRPAVLSPTDPDAQQSDHDTLPSTHRPRHSATRQQGGAETESDEQQTFNWKPIIPSYRLAQIRRQQPASPRFQAFAIAVILALLALLAYIIYHASLLS